MLLKNLKQEENIFTYIKPYDNTDFSKLTGLDLQELINYIETYYLEYREILGFDDDVTFGLEIELEKARYKIIERALVKNITDSSWTTTTDGSLYRGIEINSPILTDTKLTWINLEKVCSISKKHSHVCKSCGGHIHVGSQVLGTNLESWRNFLKLWAAYENIIYRFTNGEFLTPRPKINKYAQPISIEFLGRYNALKDFKLGEKMFFYNLRMLKNQAVNFLNVRDINNVLEGNTLEFRCPNGSLKPIIWQNNVNLFINMLLYCKSSKFNNDIVEKRLKLNEKCYSNLELYNELYIDQALEFSDIIFNTNIDKIYFLRQYFKSFEIGKKDMEKAKTFVKKSKK